MPIHLWGTDFRRSSSQFRSKLYLTDEEKETHLKRFNLDGNGIVYLHTCNRVEFYAATRDSFLDARAFWVEMLQSLGLTEADFHKGYQKEGKGALRHLIRVTSSLESLAIGEPQILGQVKEAWRWSSTRKMCHGDLDRAFQIALGTAKAIRTQTEIGKHPTSIASLALHEVARLRSQHPLRSAVLVGRSPIIKLTLRWLEQNAADCRVLWVNRSREALQVLPEAGGHHTTSLAEFLERPVPFSHLFTATSSRSIIFRSSFLEKHARGSLVVDYAQPPDAEPFAGGTLLNIKHFQNSEHRNLSLRKESLHDADRLVENSLREYFVGRQAAPILTEFRELDAIAFNELTAALNRLPRSLSFSTDDRTALEQWATALVKRQLHLSREHLRRVLRKLSGQVKSVKKDAA